jgi:hypothetical protein
VNTLPAIVRLPVRLAPELLVATMKVTVPVPAPGPALISAIQAVLLSAVHEHVGAAVTVLLPEPPLEVNDREVGDIDGAQLLGAACETVKVLPPRFSVPVRVEFPVLGATLKVTLPVPDPLTAPVMVIQESLLLASHEHPAVAVTVVLPAPPAASNAWLVGETLYEQPVPA